MFTSVKAFIELLDVTSAPVDIPVSFVFSASVKALVFELASYAAVSYTHLTLPTTREV